jgi:hypothetical protein
MSVWGHYERIQRKKTRQMKTIIISSAFLSLLTLAIPSVNAQSTFTGPSVADGSAPADGGAISSVVVNNTASTITFTINSTQPMASYIFYAIEIQSAGGGYTGLSNPWGPAVGISTGENALINTYGTGASALTYSGGTWTQNASASFVAGGAGSSFATMTFSLSSLGLSIGSSFNFDVVSSYTTPGGQAAYGALDMTTSVNSGYLAESDNSFEPWLGSNNYDSATATGSTFSSTTYTIQSVPEPGVCASLGLGGLILFRRVLGRKA